MVPNQEPVASAIPLTYFSNDAYQLRAYPKTADGLERPLLCTCCYGSARASRMIR